MAARLVDQLGDLRLRHALVLRELLISARLFDRIEILALQIFDQGQCHHFALIELADQRRDFMQPRALRGTPAAFARHQPVAALP